MLAANFRYGSAGGRPAPYVVSQLGGTYYSVPDFLDTQHPIRDAADADFYLSRLDQIPRSLDRETERIRHDAALRVVPPDFVLDKAIGNLQRLRDTPPAQTTLVASIARRTRAANIAGDHEGRAGPDRLRPDRRGARPADRGASGAAPRRRPRRRLLAAAGRRGLLQLGHPIEHDDER